MSKKKIKKDNSQVISKVEVAPEMDTSSFKDSLSKLGNLAKDQFGKVKDVIVNIGPAIKDAALESIELASKLEETQGSFNGDSLSNQMANAQSGMASLSGVVGTTLLPIAKEGMDTLNGMITQLNGAANAGGLEGLAGAFGGAFSQMIGTIAQQVPQIVSMAAVIIKSLVAGISANLPQMCSAAIQIVTSLINGFLEVLPLILELGIQLIANLVIGIGQALPVLIPAIIKCITDIINIIVTNLPLIIQAGLGIILGLVQGLINAIPILIEMIPQILTNLVTAIVESLPIIIQAGIQLLQALIDGIVLNLPLLVEMLPTLINSIVSVITQNLPVIIESGIQLLISLINGLLTALPQLIAMLPTIIVTIVNIIAENLPLIISAAIQIIGSLVSGLVQAIPQIVQAMPQIISSIWEAITQINWLELGGNIIGGICKGFMDGIGGFIKKVLGGFGKLVNGITDFFDIHSPSRLMRDLVGKNIIKGVSVGVEDEMPNLNSDVISGMEYLTSKMKSTVDYETARTTASVVAYNNGKLGNTSVNDEVNKKSNTPFIVNANLIVDGKEFTQTVVAPHQAILEEYYEGR